MEALSRALLASAGPTGNVPAGLFEGEIAKGVYVVDIGKSHGEDYEKVGTLACLWICFALCIGLLCFYAYHTWRATCGWEEIYVASIERAPPRPRCPRRRAAAAGAPAAAASPHHCPPARALRSVTGASGCL